MGVHAVCIRSALERDGWRQEMMSSRRNSHWRHLRAIDEAAAGRSRPSEKALTAAPVAVRPRTHPRPISTRYVPFSRSCTAAVWMRSG